MTLKQIIGIPLMVIFAISLGYQLLAGMEDLGDGWLTAFFVSAVALILTVAIKKVLQS